MAEPKEPKERIRKEYAPNGQRSQKMFAFRIDFENYEHVKKQPNGGRYINDLIAADRQQ